MPRLDGTPERAVRAGSPGVEQRLGNAVASRILTGEIADGQHVTIDAAGKAFKFRAAGDAVGDVEVIEGEVVEE